MLPGNEPPKSGLFPGRLAPLAGAALRSKRLPPSPLPLHNFLKPTSNVLLEGRGEFKGAYETT